MLAPTKERANTCARSRRGDHRSSGSEQLALATAQHVILSLPKFAQSRLAEQREPTNGACEVRKGSTNDY